MRVLVVGANLAGLLSAQHFIQQGHEVTLLAEAAPAADRVQPPHVFSDPGHWGTAQGAIPTCHGLLKNCGDLRLSLEGLGHLGWLLRCLSRRWGSRARSQALQALALARRSQALFQQMSTSGTLPAGLEPLTMLSLYPDGRLAEAQRQRGPMWQLGSKPTRCHGQQLNALLPHMDGAWRDTAQGLLAQGLMLVDAGAVQSSLRQQLVNAGARIVFDHSIDGVIHAGQHIHAVTLRGRLGLPEELDTDLVLATAFPLAQPLLGALGISHGLAPLTQWSLHTRLDTRVGSAQWVHDHHHGVRLIRSGQDLWAQGPARLGGPEGDNDRDLVLVRESIQRHFGLQAPPLASAAGPQVHWVAPDGLPVVQRTPMRNLILNLGHHSALPSLAWGALASLQTLLEASRPTVNRLGQGRPWPAGQIPLTAPSQGLSHD